MEKLNYDKCAADLLVALKPLTSRCDDSLCDDYGLWESLSVDMLSPEETRLLAEHLEQCERCRKECENAHALGVYEDSPLYDRMRDYRKNPAAETDENWVKIACAFDKTLAEVVVVSFEDSNNPLPRPASHSDNNNIVNDNRLSVCYAAPSYCSNPVPRLIPVTNPASRPDVGKKVNWRSLSRSLSYSCAAAVLLGVGVCLILPNTPSGNDEPVAIRDVNPSVQPKSVFGGKMSAVDSEESPENVAPESASTPFGVVKEQNSADVNFEMVGVQLNDDGLNALYQAVVAPSQDAASKSMKTAFEELDQALKNAEVDDKTLINVYWNCGVAAMKGEKWDDAKYIFNALNEMNLNDDMSENVNAALEQVEKKLKEMNLNDDVMSEKVDAALEQVEEKLSGN